MTICNEHSQYTDLYSAKLGKIIRGFLGFIVQDFSTFENEFPKEMTFICFLKKQIVQKKSSCYE